MKEEIGFTESTGISNSLAVANGTIGNRCNDRNACWCVQPTSL